ncbi:MAG: DUF309 domain-containing protein [Nitrospinota bacterium]
MPPRGIPSRNKTLDSPRDAEPLSGPISFGGRAREGVALFNDRAYWESHEAWEDLWREGNPAERRFYQGLIQVAAGFVKIQKAWHAPAVLNLQKGLSKLEGLKDPDVPINLKGFVREVRAVLEKLKADGRVKFEREEWTRWPKIAYLPRRSAGPAGREADDSK